MVAKIQKDYSNLRALKYPQYIRRKPKKDILLLWLKKRKKLQFVIAGITAALGLAMIGTQAIPFMYSYLQVLSLKGNSIGFENPVPEAEAGDGSTIAHYDVDKSYFQNLVENLQNGQKIYGPNGQVLGAQASPIFIDTNYNKPMYLDIPAFGITQLHITPNVNSYDEKEYNKALKKGAAHFKGTPMPGDNDFGNFVVYGHSALPSFFNRHPNYTETMFTRIHQLRIGSDITVYKDDKIYRYVVVKNMRITPSEFDVIQGIPGESTITLLTCWPAGDPKGRWVSVGRLETVENSRK